MQTSIFPAQTLRHGGPKIPRLETKLNVIMCGCPWDMSGFYVSSEEISLDYTRLGVSQDILFRYN
jgi:hypothetical protein